ncbi:MAG TPA: Crp/Fnr family transcriptional regulator [Candidatus Limnocylindria bacterium]
MPREHGSDERIDRAIGSSFLASLPDAAAEQLVADAALIDVPAGGIVYRDEDAPRSGIVVAGLVRVYLSSAEGRQLTVRYARPGGALGLPTAIRGPVRVGAQAVTDSALLMFSATRLASIAAEDVRVAWPLAQEVTGLLYGVLDAYADTAFGSVRQRLARHLLDLATASQRDARLVAEVSQQALADAVGTAREVVARTLHDFRSARLIQTGRRGIVLLDPDRIEWVASTGDL